MKTIHFQAALTIAVLLGGGYVAIRNDQPLEIRLPVAAIAGGAVAWWFKSPLQDGKNSD